MSKRKTMDKAQARERRNRLLESAAAAQLSLTEGVREMRAISGMTQEEFARHREVSARVIKALELGQGNPTVATLNRIGEFFGLEVGFVPINRTPVSAAEPLPPQVWTKLPTLDQTSSAVRQSEILEELRRMAAPENIRKIAQEVFMRGFSDAILEIYGSRSDEQGQIAPPHHSKDRSEADASAPRKKRKSGPS